MAGGKSYYLSHKVLDHAVGKTSFTMPTNVYMALLTSAPTAATTGQSTTVTSIEATYTTYGRSSAIASSMRTAGTPTNGQTSNSGAITFPAVTAGTSTIVAFCTIDSSSGAGNMLYWGTITSKTVDTSNTPPTVGVDALVITEV